MSEFRIPEGDWLIPWEPIPAERKTDFEAELQSELCSGHPLEGATVKAIARRSDTDDVLFANACSEGRI
jgi:hypothetical protein